MLTKLGRMGIIMSLCLIISSCSSTSGSNSLLRIFSQNPEREVNVAIKDATEKQLKDAWDKKAMSSCQSNYQVVKLDKVISTAGGHNMLSGTVSCI